MTSPQAPAFRRVVSRWQIVTLALNDVIGSGIYLLPAAAAALLGPWSVWAVVVAGGAVLLIVLCFAEAATYFDQPGGAYLYAREAFGDFVGFEVGWMTWLARTASVAALSAGFAQAAAFLWPGVAGGWARGTAIVAPTLALTYLNYIGIRSGVRTAVVLVIGKVVPLLVFVALGVKFAQASRVAAQPAGSGDLSAAALLLLYAYAGFENTPAPAGEYRDPRRDLPFALVFHIVVIMALYATVQWVALATLENAAASATPLADAARGMAGPAAGLLLTIGATLSILGTNSESILIGPRYLHALARDGYGPAILGRLHPRYRTPDAALFLQIAIALPLALTGTFVGLATLSVVARLSTYFGTIAALPVLRRRLGHEGSWRLPGGLAIPLVAAAVTLALVASATARHLASAGIALAVGAAIYKLRRP
ncbi:MAG: amino acid permease [Acidobacteriota bacterium]|nr:amino acid permease [Acidobacteriota bacterium]MDH3523892.1 amino acid permease [Acidobacteriota bacterium]